MLSGTPMFSRSEDIMRQSRLMPGGGLFSSKEHYKAMSTRMNSGSIPRGLHCNYLTDYIGALWWLDLIPW